MNLIHRLLSHILKREKRNKAKCIDKNTEVDRGDLNFEFKSENRMSCLEQKENNFDYFPNYCRIIILTIFFVMEKFLIQYDVIILYTCTITNTFQALNTHLLC